MLIQQDHVTACNQRLNESTSELKALADEAVMDFVFDIGVEAVADVNASSFAAVTTALELDMPTSTEEFSC